jgi:hypothetical protein
MKDKPKEEKTPLYGNRKHQEHNQNHIVGASYDFSRFTNKEPACSGSRGGGENSPPDFIDEVALEAKYYKYMVHIPFLYMGLHCIN